MNAPSGLSFDRATKLVARNLGISMAGLLEGFQPATAADLAEIVSLRQAVHGGPATWDDSRYLSWRYGLASSRKSYATLRVLRIGGRLIAGVGAEEFALSTPAGQVQAACAMDILCLDRYRDFGLGAWLNLALFEQYPLVLATGSNENSRGLVKSLYGSLGLRYTMQFPIDARPFVRKRISIPLVGAGLGALVNVFVGMHRGWFNWKHKVNIDAVRRIDRFDSHMEFSSKAPSRTGWKHIARHADYLNWRYCENPRAHYECVGFFEGSTLRSHMVYSLPESGSQMDSLRIADWWLDDPSDLKPLCALSAHLVAESRRRNIKVLAADVIGTEMVRELRGAGFIRSSSSGMAAGWQASDPTLRGLLAPAHTWCLTGLGEDMDDV